MFEASNVSHCKDRFIQEVCSYHAGAERVARC
jgi:hypothetical protein